MGLKTGRTLKVERFELGQCGAAWKISQKRPAKADLGNFHAYLKATDTDILSKVILSLV